MIPFVSAHKGGFLGFLAASSAIPFITETDEKVWNDCLWASGLMAALRAGVNAPPTRHEREALRVASGDTEGGSNLGDLNRGLKARYGIEFERPDDWGQRELLNWLEESGGAVLQIVYRELGEPYIRWDRRFASRRDGGLHGVYADHYKPLLGIYLMDPLGRGRYPGTAEPFAGEYVPVERVIRALDAFRRRVGGRGFSVALARAPRPRPAPAPLPTTILAKEPMTNLFPLQVKYVIDLPIGTLLLDAPNGNRHSIVGPKGNAKTRAFGLIDAVGTHYKIASGDYGVWVPRSVGNPRLRGRAGDPLNVGS